MAQQYRPLFKLDSGGMAEVYVAEAVSLQGFKKTVAIKRILPGLLKSDRFVRMFLDEARLSMHLSHANVVTVFDIGKTDNTYFIVMEYVEGTTLKSLMEWHHQRDHIVPVPVTVWIVNEILGGLAYAHGLTDPETGKRLGIIHRDISPPNILVSWNGEVKLTDFGLAKATTQLESTEPGVVKGKFAYLSPEAANGQAIDQRTDVFAVGILLYEMLTGRRLFLGESDWQTIENVRRGDVPSIRALNPRVPEALEAICRKALAVKPSERYAAASDFADELVTVMWGMRPSRRDLIELLATVRREQPTRTQAQTSPKGTNLILDLLDEELTHFHSIDDDGDASPSQPPAPYESLIGSLLGGEGLNAEYDPSKPLVPQLAADESMNAGKSATVEPISEAKTSEFRPAAHATATRLRREEALAAAGDDETPADALSPVPRALPLRSPAPRPESQRTLQIVAAILVIAAGIVSWFAFFG